MIKLYVLKQSRANRIAWLLETLNLPYEVEIFERDRQTKFAPPALQKIHPLGKSPIIQDGELILAESGAIVEYLIERYGQGKLKPPADSADYPHYLHWLHYAEGSLMFPLLLSLIFRKIDSTKMPFFVKSIAHKITAKVKQGFIEPRLKQHLDYVENALAGKTWLVGDRLSGADIMMSFPLKAVLLRSELNYPNIRSYVNRIEALASWQKAEQKIGKLELDKL